MDFQDQVVIVTGAGQGIGEAVAKRFGTGGATVVVADLNSSSGNETVAAIKENGADSIFKQTDVSSSQDVRGMIDSVISELGKINVLANIAGQQGMVADIVELPEEEWEKVMNVNITSVYLCSKYTIPHMVKQGGGSIVNVASMQSFFNMPKSSAYAAAKGGIVSLTRSMALDFAPNNIRVNAVAPGYVDTPLLRGFAQATGDEEGAIEKWNSRIPMGRLQQPSEIAEVVAFVASTAASAVTGVTYPVDGGILTAQPFLGD